MVNSRIYGGAMTEVGRYMEIDTGIKYDVLGDVSDFYSDSVYVLMIRNGKMYVLDCNELRERFKKMEGLG